MYVRVGGGVPEAGNHAAGSNNQRFTRSARQHSGQPEHEAYGGNGLCLTNPPSGRCQFYFKGKQRLKLFLPKKMPFSERSGFKKAGTSVS